MDQEFDQENIDSIKALLKEKFCEIAKSYIKNAQKYLAGIEEGINNEDAKKIEDNAHPLKSASGMMGLARLKELAEIAEDRAIEGISDFKKTGEFYELYTELLSTSQRGFHKLEAECKALEA